jgi:hypothetical protein
VKGIPAEKPLYNHEGGEIKFPRLAAFEASYPR